MSYRPQNARGADSADRAATSISSIVALLCHDISRLEPAYYTLDTLLLFLLDCRTAGEIAARGLTAQLDMTLYSKARRPFASCTPPIRHDVLHDYGQPSARQAHASASPKVIDYRFLISHIAIIIGATTMLAFRCQGRDAVRISFAGPKAVTPCCARHF